MQHPDGVFNGPTPHSPPGLSSMSVPLYIAESSPASMRGKLVVLNVAFITGGQFLASVVDGAFSEVPEGWRWVSLSLSLSVGVM